MKKERKGTKLKCPNCTYKWTYTGVKKVTTTCPDCMKKIKIQENKVQGG